jgi:hypothetical protein
MEAAAALFAAQDDLLEASLDLRSHWSTCWTCSSIPDHSAAVVTECDRTLRIRPSAEGRMIRDALHKEWAEVARGYCGASGRRALPKLKEAWAARRYDVFRDLERAAELPLEFGLQTAEPSGLHHESSVTAGTYRVLGRTRLREAFAADSRQLGFLQPEEVVEVAEGRLNDRGALRLRLQTGRLGSRLDGWANAVGGDGTLLLAKQLWQAIVEHAGQCWPGAQMVVLSPDGRRHVVSVPPGLRPGQSFQFLPVPELEGGFDLTMDE